MNAKAAIVGLAAGSAVLAVGTVAGLVGVATLQAAISTPTSFEPGADPGFLEYQRLVQLFQVLWSALPWLAFVAYLPAIGALVIAALRPRNPRVLEETAA